MVTSDGAGRQEPHRLSREQARRIAVRAQLLDAHRPTDPLAVIRHLTFLQVDLTAAVAPSADVVLWSRLGAAYRPEDLDALVDNGSLVELQLRLRPAEDLALFRADMAAWPGREPLRDWEVGLAEWVADNDGCRRDILEILRADGPLPARELPDTCVRPWRSTGWTNSRNVQRLLDFMEARGEVAVAGREGRDRLWDLAERIYPDERVVPALEAEGIRNARRLAALGIARPSAAETPGEPDHVAEAGEEAVIEGVRGRWRVDPTQLDRSFEGRVALLSPLDRLVFDRKRLADIFESDYTLEMYKPAAQRRWGYWAMPVLVGDRILGKLDASTDLDAGLLRVTAVHEDEPFDAATRAAVDAEIADLAAFLGVAVAGA